MNICGNFDECCDVHFDNNRYYWTVGGFHYPTNDFQFDAAAATFTSKNHNWKEGDETFDQMTIYQVTIYQKLHFGILSK